MKSSSFLLSSGAAFLLASCGALKTVNQPLTGNGFDPLDGPGQKRKSGPGLIKPTGPSYKPGQWVETAMANSTFFRQMPTGSAAADKVLKARTPLKVIKMQGSFVKVELDSGDVGFVPSIMVAERPSGTSYTPVPTRSPNEVPIIPGSATDQGSVEGLPPLPDIPPLPDVDGSSPEFSPPPVIEQPKPVEVTPDLPPPLPDLPPPPEVPGLTEPVNPVR